MVGGVYTVWRFQDFSVIQILCEIKFGESRSSEMAVFANFGARNCVNLIISAFQSAKIHKKSKFTAPKFVKLADFALLEFPNLISRKI